MDGGSCWIGSRPDIDPPKAVIYRQSDLPEVAEMALLLGMTTPLGWLERVPSFKERLRDMAEREVANYGLLGYPVLQAVDITIVRGELVPVGQDQVAHLELSREIVRRFNGLYGDRPRGAAAAPLGDADDPGQRRPQDVEVARQLHRHARRPRHRARQGALVHHRPAEGAARRSRPPGDLPHLRAARHFSPADVDRIEATCRTGELGCVDCKTLLADHLIETFAPYRERRAEAGGASPGSADRCWPAGRDGRVPVAQETLAAVRSAMELA